MEHENLRDLKTANPGFSWALFPLGGTVGGGIPGCSQGAKDFPPLSYINDLVFALCLRAFYHGSKRLSMVKDPTELMRLYNCPVPTQEMVMNFNLFLQGGVLHTLDSRYHNGLNQKEQNYF